MKKLLLRLSIALLTFTLATSLTRIIAHPLMEQKYQETVLRQNLQALRRAIDQYAADKQALPQSLDDLVRLGYIREIPPDPITGEKDWKVDIEEDTISPKGGTGVVDLHSNASGNASEGVSYNDF